MSPLSGALLIDKPSGPTSHDVVQRLRRSLGTRRVGHAGTLDPLATGLLVALIGEATKLEPYIASAEKTYVARVVLGRTTDTLDLEGTQTSATGMPHDLRAEIDRRALNPRAPTPLLASALEVERRREEQHPPSFSAIKVDGVRSHVRARSGEAFVLPPRPVRVVRLTMSAVGLSAELDGSPFLDVELTVSKGYYVRAFARDLGLSLGTGAVLAKLRRTRSGPFDIDAAVSSDASLEFLESALVPLDALARRALPSLELTAIGLERARHGKVLSAGSDIVTEPSGAGPFALMGPGGQPLVAVASASEDGIRVLRGFAAPG